MKMYLNTETKYMSGSYIQRLARKPSVLFWMLVLYRIMLDASYEQIEYLYEYQGLFENNKTLASSILSWALFLGFAPFVVRLFSGKQFSDTVMVLLALFSLIPQTTVIAYRSDYSSLFQALIVVFWILLYAAHSFSSPIHFRYSPSKATARIPYITLVVLVLSVIAFSLVHTGLRLHVDLIDVYEIREEARTFSAPFPVNYILSFADNALAFFVILLLYKRQLVAMLGVLFAIFVNFSITGTKQIVFVVLCGLLGYFFIKNKTHSHRLLIGAVLLIAGTYIEERVNETYTLATLYPYRVLFIPAELHYSYFSFFQMNELDLYRQSLLKAVFDSPYSTNIQFLIGEYSIGDITARANNGLFSDAFMNIGLVGVFLYPFIIALLLRLFDGAVSRLDTRLWFVLAIYSSFVLLGMTLSTALLTSGMLPFLLMLYTFPHCGHPVYKNTYRE